MLWVFNSLNVCLTGWLSRMFQSVWQSQCRCALQYRGSGPCKQHQRTDVWHFNKKDWYWGGICAWGKRAVLWHRPFTKYWTVERTSRIRPLWLCTSSGGYCKNFSWRCICCWRCAGILSYWVPSTFLVDFSSILESILHYPQ